MNTMSEEDTFEKPDVVEGQQCPVCGKETLCLREMKRDIPFFGEVFLFSMTCTNCRYHKSDVECPNIGEPKKYTIDIDSEEDLNIRVVKSADATVKIPRIMTVDPGVASNGYISNIEGVLSRLKDGVERAKTLAESDAAKKKAKNLIKKLNRVMWGQEKITLIIEDPTGNSAIISEKVKVTKLK